MSHLHVLVEPLITHETDLVEGQEQRPEIAWPHTQNNTLHLREELSAKERRVEVETRTDCYIRCHIAGDMAYHVISQGSRHPVLSSVQC